MTHNLDDADARMMTLEELLEALSYWGAPAVTQLDNGWHCCIKVHTRSPGAKFDARSDFGMCSPWAATVQAANRLRACLDTIENAPRLRQDAKSGENG